MPKRNSAPSFSHNSSSSNFIRLTMSKAKKLAKSPDSCVEIVDDTRTVSLPWTFLGRLDEGIELVLDRILHNFRRKLSGVPIARGKHEIVDRTPVILDDHPNFHLSVSCPVAVFRPRIGAILPAQIVRIDEGQIACSIYGVITANVWRTRGKKSHKHEASLNVGDEIMLRITKIRLYRRSLQLNAEISRHMQS